MNEVGLERMRRQVFGLVWSFSRQGFGIQDKGSGNFGFG